MAFRKGYDANRYVRPRDAGLPIRRMTAEERSRVPGNQTGDVWASFGDSASNKWGGTFTNPIDITHAPRERDRANPWAL